MGHARALVGKKPEDLDEKILTQIFHQVKHLSEISKIIRLKKG